MIWYMTFRADSIKCNKPYNTRHSSRRRWKFCREFQDSFWENRLFLFFWNARIYAKNMNFSQQSFWNVLSDFELSGVKYGESSRTHVSTKFIRIASNKAIRNCTSVTQYFTERFKLMLRTERSWMHTNTVKNCRPFLIWIKLQR